MLPGCQEHALCGNPPTSPPLLPPPCPRSELLLEQLWAALPADERAAVLARLALAESREKLPAVKSLAAQLAAKLRLLGAALGQ